MARIDEHFELFLKERQQDGLTPQGEVFFREAWSSYRQLPGSARLSWTVLSQLPVVQAGTGSEGRYRRMRALAQIVAWMGERGVCRPLSLHWRPKPRRVEGRTPLSHVEVMAVVDRIEDPGVRTLAQLVYQTGLRPRVLLSLTPADVDVRGHTLTFCPDPGSRGMTLGMQTEVMDVLRRWMTLRRSDAATLLHDGHGHPLSLQAASRALRNAGRAAGHPVGFGSLQYAHTRLLAHRYPMFNQDLVELRLQQTFRLRYLRIPGLFDGP